MNREPSAKLRRQRVSAARAWLAVIVVIGIFLGGYDVWTTYLNHQQNNEILALQTRNHAEVTAQNAKLQQEAEAIKYEGAVIVYQNAEILSAQKQGHDTLAAIQNLQQLVSTLVPQAAAALKGGQAQINTYLRYLTCLATDGNEPSVCGPAPPLPSTA